MEELRREAKQYLYTTLYSSDELQQDLHEAIAKLQERGANVLFRFATGQDIKDSTRVIAQASQGGGQELVADLAGLPKSYIVQQMADYKSGARGTSVAGRTSSTLMTGLGLMPEPWGVLIR